MSINKKILILGDSWSQGEISDSLDENEKHIVSHKGTEQYLRDDGYIIDNRGEIGESNHWATVQFDRYTGSPDSVIWFQTDVNRDLTEQMFLTKLKESGSIKSVFRSHIIDTYTKMNSLAENKNTTVFVVGGFSAVLEDELRPFKNLKCAIPCIINLIRPNINLSFYDRFSQQSWFKNLIELVKSDSFWSKDDIIRLKSEWLAMQSGAAKFHRVMQQDKEYFWPDGCHPNRQGHKIIYNKIKTILENE